METEVQTQEATTNESNSEAVNSQDNATLLGSLESVVTEELGTTDHQPAEKKEDIPESYEFKLPESISLDPAKLETLQTLAREAGFTQNIAQSVLDFGLNLVTETIDSHKKQFNELVEGWKNDSIKALGADYQKEMSFAKRAIDQFMGEDAKNFQSESNELGFGNHPSLVKFMINVGKAISEDSFVNGSKSGVAEKELKDRLFS